ncbi:af404749_1syntaxin 6 [Plasmopara halstedii]|uniref:Af404749_1syntaxin 6 n=1 Tax=Plasmopara halstedii TaxID=4781 RepID=A0A0P1A7V4_PLAHL|nr:af404749_1syntaxin 6 [Plasmopara halstedii]CEG36328.1 af404749_1syntaxin 6 [Plasmopara halstedii]|eukprot:XP_024572697.1 af404749_1syntaxin 6 [Plasmopara halstedii]
MKKMPSLAAASGDPFYVFRDELENKVLAVRQKYAQWRTILEATDSPATKNLPALTHQIEGAVTTAEKSVKFLEETIVMVEANRAKFEHIDAAEIASRKAFVAATRKELRAVSTEISAEAVKSRIRQEERKLMQKSTTSLRSNLSEHNRNKRFLKEETQRQQQVMQEQDQSLEGLHTDITRLHNVTVEISSEVQQQNKMLDELTNDVDEAQERMNFVMGSLSKFLKTKDTCQLGLILFLMAVLVIMVFLVVYT